MKITVDPITENPVTLLRRAGYVFQRKDGEEMSFVRPFSRSGFPRFHCYASTKDGSLRLSLHLDRKKETYGESTRHHGEYEDEGPVAEETKRLVSAFGENARIIS